MSTGKHMDRVCVIAVAVCLILTFLFMSGTGSGLVTANQSIGYEDHLFSTDTVHQIDIVMDDWDSFIETCENEAYSSCTVLIDGEKYSGIGIRAKGNTSLSSVRSMGSERYSFKLEFDQYDSTKSYHGLDKLCLNNLIQDNTLMKDYLVYQMMGDFGVDTPLCSYAFITVNGEDWGLYLAVEGVEDSFLQRNYGSDAGNLYKPDSMSFGGGRGNGKDFNIEELDFSSTDGGSMPQMPEGFDGTAGSGMPQMPEGFDGTNGDSIPQMPKGFDGTDSSSMPQMPEGFSGTDGSVMPQLPEGFDGTNGDSIPQMPKGFDGTAGSSMPQLPEGFGGTDGSVMPQLPGGFGGMGSDDVKLKYIDDDPDSYANIFDNAKTRISDKDKTRLISALRRLNDYTELENTLDIEEVLRYFVVHNFVVNGDSYTGSMIHNYYLHEKDGLLSMIPWDYNLAFGTFQGGNASQSVNASIDNPVSGGSNDDRPMLGWIFSDEAYTEQYHALFTDFIQKWIEDGKLAQMIETTADLIRPYAEKDPTKFCTMEEFEAGVTAITSFVTLRGEAVSRQLSGDCTAVETDGLNLSDMGTMNNGRNGDFGGFNRGEKAGLGGFNRSDKSMGNPFSTSDNSDSAPQQGEVSDSQPQTNASDSQVQNKAPDSLVQNDASDTAPQQGDVSGSPPQNDASSDSAPQKTSSGNSQFSGSGQSSGRKEDARFPAGQNGMNIPDIRSNASQNEAWIWLAVSMLILLAGLVFANRSFRR